MSQHAKLFGPNPIARIAAEGFKMAEKAATVDFSEDTLEGGFAGPLKKASKWPCIPRGSQMSLSALRELAAWGMEKGAGLHGPAAMRRTGLIDRDVPFAVGHSFPRSPWECGL